MHLKQLNNLINQIWTTKNFRQEASSGSLCFHPVLGNKKSDYPKKCQSNFAFWFAVVHVHCRLKVNTKHNFYFIIIVVCYSFQSPADLTKSGKYASFTTMILIL